MSDIDLMIRFSSATLQFHPQLRGHGAKSRQPSAFRERMHATVVVPTEAGTVLWQSRNMRLGTCSKDSHRLVQNQHSCSSGTGRGAIAMPGNVSWLKASRLCLAHCLSCEHCNHVSLSVERGYCAWYAVCSYDSLHIPSSHTVFSGSVPKSEHAWLARAHSDPPVDAPPKPSQLQVRLDAAMRRRPLRYAQPGARGLHYRDACLQNTDHWVLAVGTSVMRIFFMRLVEEHVSIDKAPTCLPGWRFQSHGVCNSLKLGAPCVIDVRSNSSAGSMRFTFVWAFGWAQRAGLAGYRMFHYDAFNNNGGRRFSDSEAAAGHVLVGRFGAQSAEVLRQILYEASPKVPDLLLAGPDAWNLRDPLGVRASNIASFLDFLLGSHVMASGTACVWLGARQSSGRRRRQGFWQQTLAEFEQEEAQLRNVVAARRFAYLDPAFLPPCEADTEAVRMTLLSISSPGSRSCSVEDCSGYTARNGDRERCQAYGTSPCHFAGDCSGPHVYGRALSHMVHALLRSMCEEVPGDSVPLRVGTHQLPSLQNADAFEQRWKNHRRGQSASLDAVARPGNGSKPRKLALTCACWYKPRLVSRRRAVPLHNRPSP